jgi:PAS domain-containing protein
VSRYGIAIAAPSAAGISHGFRSIVGVYAPYVPFALAVTIAAFFGGRGPGLAADALSALVVKWFFLKPVHSLAFADPAAAWALGFFVVSVAPIALLVGSLREALLARARTEEALRKHAKLIDLSHDAVITMDRERRIITWNRGAEEIYGWTQRDAVGQMMHYLLQTESRIPLAETSRNSAPGTALGGGDATKSFRTELQRLHRSGKFARGGLEISSLPSRGSSETLPRGTGRIRCGRCGAAGSRTHDRPGGG